MAKKKYQVFISSTYNDLVEERQIAIQSVLKKGHIPAGMELFKSDDRSQKKVIEKWLIESDIYMLILGARYGSIDPETNLSYTEWEYKKAVELKKPRFIIILNDSYLIDKNIDYKVSEVNLPLYIKFKENLTSGGFVHFVSNLDQLNLKINESLEFIISENPELKGWIDGDFLDEYETLRKEYNKLAKKLINRSDEVINLQNKTFVRDSFIGDYEFDYLKNVFNERGFSEKNLLDFIESLTKTILEVIDEGSKLVLEKDLNELKEIRNNNTLKNVLLLNKDVFFSNSFRLPGRGIHRLYGQELAPALIQYNLGSVEKALNTLNREVKHLLLNENGMKFLSLLEYEEKQ